jgi:hypothetical protein
MSPFFKSAVVLFPLFFVTACGGSGSSGNGGGTGSEPDVRAAGAACGGNVANPGTCGAGYECIRAPGALPDVAGSCTATDGRRCGGNIQNPPPPCPDGFKCTGAAGSPPVGDVGGTCQKPTASVGQPCGGKIANAKTCDPGLECIGAPGALPDSPGSCTATEGRACGGNIQNPPLPCPDGFKCTGSGTAPVGDVGGTCHKS